MECMGKNILFIMTRMNNMENEIISALEEKGANVDFYDDPTCFGTNTTEKNKYWKSKITDFKKYDILFWIDGYSFDPIVIEKVLELNPSIHKILYLWDDMHYYDWSSEFKYFDKIYSFEEDDCKEYGLNYLPLYWTSYKNLSSDKKYDLSYVGAFTEDRMKVIDSLLPSLEGYEYKLNLIRPVNKSLLGTIKRIIKKLLKMDNPELKRDYILDVGIDKSEFDIITANSKCVLDMVKLTQKGFTNRSMQALGNGIKIISTNTNFKDCPFFDSDLIYILNPEKINVKEIIEFIENPVSPRKNKYIEELELSNWISRL